MCQDYKSDTDAVRFKYATVEESEEGLEKSDNWEAISTEDFGKFRKPYFDKIDLTNELWEKSKMQWAWGNKVELSFDSSGLKLNRNQHFYGFDRLLVVDDVVYGVADGLGILPGIDIAGDILGVAYAGIVRRDLGNTLIYTASASVPFVGAAYVKGGLKAGEDASHLFGIVAKKADNVEGFVLETKRIKDIQAR
ncbi:hypothetical protein [Myroides sp. WP-1]|uniref:hypothetical protein n=1 Tax=Myroides sp. WP-1 TaxID=2759944 RepID=UPI0015FBF043|nr:hypothetical protein [Myroides sp. WP-1]MBB1140669.1 hypothetical protein [Myroides sp. WP-1]